jgi:hypothetical protein
VKEPSLLWIDWRLSPWRTARDTAWRAAFLALASFALLALLLSGGADRFLASRYAIVAVLRTPVPDGEGEGLAKKVSDLPPVLSAAYKDPEAAWKEFLLAYPGLESLRAAGGNPVPGYIEIRLRPERMTRADIDTVARALRPVPFVETVLAGEDRLPRLLQVRRWAAALAWGGYGAFALLVSLLFLLQDRLRAVSLAADLAYLESRCAPAGRLVVSRAAGAALSGFALGLVGLGAGAAALRHLLLRYPTLETLVGAPDELLSPRIAAAAAGYLLCAVLLSAVASLVGFRTARAGRK